MSDPHSGRPIDRRGDARIIRGALDEVKAIQTLSNPRCKGLWRDGSTCGSVLPGIFRLRAGPRVPCGGES